MIEDGDLRPSNLPECSVDENKQTVAIFFF